MKKKIGNVVLALFVLAIGVVACSDSKDIEPVNIEPEVEFEDRIKLDSDTGDIICC